MIIDTIKDIVEVSKMKAEVYSHIYLQGSEYSKTKKPIQQQTLKLKKSYDVDLQLETTINIKSNPIVVQKRVDKYSFAIKLDYNVKTYRFDNSSPDIESDLLKLFNRDPSYHSILNQATQKIRQFHMSLTFLKKHHKVSEDDEPISIIECRLSEMILARCIIINVRETKIMKEIASKSLVEILYPRIFRILTKGFTDSYNDVDNMLDINNEKISISEIDSTYEYYNLSEDSEYHIISNHVNKKLFGKLKNVDLSGINPLENMQDKIKEQQLAQNNAVNEKRKKDEEDFVYNSQIAKEELRNFEEHYRDILLPLRKDFDFNYTVLPNLLKYKNTDYEKRYFVNMVIYDGNTYRNLRSKLFIYFNQRFEKFNLKLRCYAYGESDNRYSKFEFIIDKHEVLAFTELVCFSSDLLEYFKYMFLTKILLAINL